MKAKCNRCGHEWEALGPPRKKEPVRCGLCHHLIMAQRYARERGMTLMEAIKKMPSR
jgi:DNA-directed RNA polymerase subunit RPC12/RpoP